MKKYNPPRISIIEISGEEIICSSISINRVSKKETVSQNIYYPLSQIQRLAALHLMQLLGSSCSGTEQDLCKINHIIKTEMQNMSISANHLSLCTFNDIKEITDELKGADRLCLESIFWACYCIVSVGKSKEAVQLLISCYEEIGFNEQECLSILEKRTGFRNY